MLYKVEFCTVHGDSIFSLPEVTETEYIDTDSDDKLTEYILSKKDGYGHSFERGRIMFQGFQFISSAGGVKISKYKPPKIIKL